MNETSPYRRTGTQGGGRSRQVAAWLFILYVAGCIYDGPAVAQDGLDGHYKGKLILTNVTSSGNCVETNLEQVMVVQRGQIYLDRKTTNTAVSLLLSGTVSPDGKVSASGVTEQQGGLSLVPHNIMAALTGEIKNGEFNGELTVRPCSYRVTLKK